jgi:hypothetical protein
MSSGPRAVACCTVTHAVGASQPIGSLSLCIDDKSTKLDGMRVDVYPPVGVVKNINICAGKEVREGAPYSPFKPISRPIYLVALQNVRRKPRRGAT